MSFKSIWFSACFSLFVSPIGEESKCVPISGDLQRRSDPLHVSSGETGGVLCAWTSGEEGNWWRRGNSGVWRRWCHRVGVRYVYILLYSLSQYKEENLEIIQLFWLRYKSFFYLYVINIGNSKLLWNYVI